MVFTQAELDAGRRAYEERQRAMGRPVIATEVAPLDLTGKELALREEQQVPPAYRKRVMNGAAVLDFTHLVLEYYGRWKYPEWTDVAALWGAHTWWRDVDGQLMFDSTGRLGLVAPPGCGKSRLMRSVRAMSCNPTKLVSSDVTAPGVRMALHNGMTVFLDEFHRTVGTGRGKEALQSVVTGGYDHEGGSLNGIGGVNEQGNFGPIAFAAQPRIITGTQDMVKDILERSFMILPSKPAPDDEVPDLDAQFTERTSKAARALELWAAEERPYADEDGKFWPLHGTPATLKNRARQIAMPLLAVADRAVDPALVEGDGEDLRWAMRARESVQAVLLGVGEPKRVMAEIEAEFRAMQEAMK